MEFNPFIGSWSHDKSSTRDDGRVTKPIFFEFWFFLSVVETSVLRCVYFSSWTWLSMYFGVLLIKDRPLYLSLELLILTLMHHLNILTLMLPTTEFPQQQP